MREKRKGLCVCQDHVRVSYLAGLGRQRQCYRFLLFFNSKQEIYLSKSRCVISCCFYPPKK